MKQFILIIIITGAFCFQALSQTKEEIQSQKATLEEQIKAKKDTLSRLEGDIKDLEGQVDALPGWHAGAFGTIGVNISQFSNWYQKDIPNSDGGAIGITVNWFANYDDPKHFWNNSGQLNLGWVKFDDLDDPDDDNGYRQATDIFNVTSLYGRRITKKIAASTLMEYRTSILSNFNDPGYLDLGVGATWEPAKGLYIVAHLLNYNFVFADSESIYESSFGAKLMADYSREFSNGITFKSNLSAFLSYESSNLSNWTWINSLNYTIWKGIGIGVEGGLRGNKQETLDYVINTEDENATFDSIDDKLQSYFLLGVSYKF